MGDENTAGSGRVALVTGAGRGLGRAHATALASAGFRVMVNDIGCDVEGGGSEESVAAQLAAELREAGFDCEADTSDIATFAGAEEAVNRAIALFGRLDVLVNNAGVLGHDRITEVDEGQVSRMLGVHFSGTVGTMRAALPGMLERGWGRVVNTVSEVALTPTGGGGSFLYAAAKAAVWSMTLSVAEEYRGTGVTVNAISPGARTRMSAGAIDDSSSSRAMNLSPEFVARAVVYLAADEAADVTGRILHVAGEQVREYLPIRRTRDTEIVPRITDAVVGNGR